MVGEIERLAAEHGVAVHGSELVGPAPAAVATEAAGRALHLPAMAADRAHEVAAAESSAGGSLTRHAGRGPGS